MSCRLRQPGKTTNFQNAFYFIFGQFKTSSLIWFESELNLTKTSGVMIFINKFLIPVRGKISQVNPREATFSF